MKGGCAEQERLTHLLKPKLRSQPLYARSSSSRTTASPSRHHHNSNTPPHAGQKLASSTPTTASQPPRRSRQCSDHSSPSFFFASPRHHYNSNTPPHAGRKLASSPYRPPRSGHASAMEARTPAFATQTVTAAPQAFHSSSCTRQTTSSLARPQDEANPPHGCAALPAGDCDQRFRPSSASHQRPLIPILASLLPRERKAS